MHYVKHFELLLCLECRLQIHLPCLALCSEYCRHDRNEESLTTQISQTPCNRKGLSLFFFTFTVVCSTLQVHSLCSSAIGLHYIVMFLLFCLNTKCLPSTLMTHINLCKLAGRPEHNNQIRHGKKKMKWCWFCIVGHDWIAGMKHLNCCIR